jgi:uncharacterized protein (DUF302 family)
MTDTQTRDIVEHTSPLPFDATVERLVQAITSHGMMIFARIDHAANARDVGMTMPPATVLTYGNAKGGTPIMLATPSVALDLPLRVLVREREDGKAVIAYHPIAETLRRAGVSEDLVTRLDPAQQMLLAAATS